MSAGSIYQRKDGYWCASLQVNGKRRTVYAKTRKEARDKLAGLQRSVAKTGVVAQPGKRTVNDLIDRWLDTAELRPTTAAHYRVVLDKHVRPALGNVRLSRLDPSDLQRLYAGLDGKRTPSKVHRLLHRALKQAVQWGWLATNPADRVDAPRYRPPRKEVWTEAQLQTFLEAIAGHKYEPFWTVALATGLRMGELLGLQWRDIDMDARTLTVRRARVSQAGKQAVLPPKTRAGERRIILPPQAVKVLRRWRAQQARLRLQAGGDWPGGDWVFTTEDGRALPRSTIQKALKRVCERLGLPTIGTHGFRHLHATLLLAEGLPVPAVSARLGHANPQVTMIVYAHALSQQDEEAADLIGRALDEATG